MAVGEGSAQFKPNQPLEVHSVLYVGVTVAAVVGIGGGDVIR